MPVAGANSFPRSLSLTLWSAPKAKDRVLMQTVHDPSLVSHYVTDAFYRELAASFKDWQRDELAVLDPAERERFRALIEREARLLDQLDFDRWLAMYSPECIYWVPGTPTGGDPRREIAMS